MLPGFVRYDVLTTTQTLTLYLIGSGLQSKQCTHTHTHLVKAVHHHVRHVFIQHGWRNDDLIKSLVVPPQSWVSGLFLTTATDREIHSDTACLTCGTGFKSTSPFSLLTTSQADGCAPRGWPVPEGTEELRRIGRCSDRWGAATDGS